MSHNGESEVNEKWCVSSACNLLDRVQIRRHRIAWMMKPSTVNEHVPNLYNRCVHFDIFSIDSLLAGAGKMKCECECDNILLNCIYDWSNMQPYRPYSERSIAIVAIKVSPIPFSPFVRLAMKFTYIPSYVFCLSAYQHIECRLINSGNLPQKKAFHFIRTDLADCTSQFSVYGKRVNYAKHFNFYLCIFIWNGTGSGAPHTPMFVHARRQ